MNILTFKTSQTVTLSSESFVITCLLSLNTWNFRMLGAPVTKQKDNVELSGQFQISKEAVVFHNLVLVYFGGTSST